MMEGYVIVLSDSFDEDSDDEFAGPKIWRAEAYRQQLEVNSYYVLNRIVYTVCYVGL